MKRRNFIKKSSILVLLHPILLYPLSNIRNIFVDPTTGLVVANYALAVGKLLGGGGTSSASISGEMLKNISKQLEIINSKVDLVLKELENIKNRIEELPNQVVTAFQDRIVYSQITEYKTIEELYLYYKNSGRENEFLNNSRKQRIEEALHEVRKARQILTSFPSVYINIPTVGIAVNLELSFMNLLGIDKIEKEIELRPVRKYLTQILYNHPNSLENKIVSLKQVLSKTKNSMKLEFSAVYDDGYPLKDRTYWESKYKYMKNIIQDENVDELIILGLIEKDQRINQFTELYASEKNTNEMTTHKDRIAYRKNLAHIRTASKKVENLQENLYYHAGLLFAGNRTLQFIQNNV